MRLVRYGEVGAEMPGILDDQGSIRDLSSIVGDISPATVQAGELERIASIDPSSLPRVEGNPRLGPCVGQIGKFVCIGLNYTDHAKETGMPIPTEPIVFMKTTSAISGPNDNIELIRGSVKTDWEVELGIVIGAHTKYVSQENALDHVAGYCVVNDVSERQWQLEQGGQWIKGKSGDTYGPIGPWLVTRDEVPDPQNLDMWLEVNDKRHQDGNTRTMIFPVSQIVSYLSQCMSLQAGDVIATGTPPGVGHGMSPPVYLQSGDVVRLSVEGLGLQQQQVVDSA
ncbi:MAG: fumarylacetoacetate hydrolase family protein [Acidiferrobacteraceae bacterium]|nr:fumarylacetoacetate hydrolase family protein [Acidiferrobacteraceae bacterium]MBT3639736.1 fumarylacetoacetate hydrolase family protein [Acidiferrobacteraceae bacterium]MBT3770807.1 fumarylacetoacetate hydrolase family protein [Acidiferrobacteraceae bacterium]MBT3973554.1 fumarylacetoacetate hydrolase family protein [Acidiferrobacteraceae bacterium]MBT4393710.1 fumarylacetoacetate hydrolase family protein [Acidiferrobacteraceae bacterium]